MAAENLDIGINITGNAAKSLSDLQTKVGKLQKGFDDLKTSIATLALDALIAKSVMFADTMQDLATATGVATNSIVGLSKSFEQNGGTADQARAAILKLTENIGAAAEGGKEAQIAFQKVGVSLGDLSKLSEQSILEKTIEGLAKIDDISTRTKVAIDLLGKGAKGVDFSGVASGYKSAAEEALKYNAAIKASAELNDKIQAAFGKLQLSILKAFEPIANAINNIDDAKLSKFIESFASMAVSLAAVATAVKGLEILGKILLFVAGSVALITGGFASLARTAAAFGTQMRAASAALAAGVPFFETLGVTLGIVATKRLPFLVSGLGMLLKGFLGVAGVVLIVNDVIDALTGKGLIGWLGTAYDKMKDFLGLQKDAASGAGAGRGDGQAELKARKEEADRIAKQQEEQKNKAREVEAYYKKQADALKSSVEQFYRSNEQAAKLLDFEASMVGKTEDQVQMQTSLNELTNKYNDEIQKLRDAKKQLGADEGGLRKVYDDQIAALQKNMAVDKERLTASVTGLQTAKLLEQDRLNTLERITQQMELQRQIAETTSGIHGDVAKQMQDIAFKQSQKGKSPVERQLDEVNKTVNEFQAQAAGKIMSVFETEDGFRNIQQMNKELEKMYAESEKLREAKIAEMKLSREWSTGWQDAFDSYMDSATNAAKIAGEQFNVVMNGMNSAIDKFVETGKFSFSDFARSIIQDLIKIELKAQATQILGAIGGGGGIFSMIGGLLGFANGGNPPINKPSVVGENGPELFVPRTAGTVIPNGGSGAGGPTAGMAPINNITNNYNVSAIDSKSVAQFFAENRKTLLGSMQLAQKELPYGNR
jgi:lambda family phage tail tape measure protein